VITGAHAIVFAEDPEAARAFFADALGLSSVDAGGGWLIFALPPAELAVHPADGADRHELYLMCDDLDATIAQLRGNGVEIVDDVSEQRWGRTTAIGIPGGGRIALYEPAHPSPLTRGGGRA
jgi:catechol 2,3-dioxygenase-like lactoylglutathione lyase family enzyme